MISHGQFCGSFDVRSLRQLQGHGHPLCPVSWRPWKETGRETVVPCPRSFHFPPLRSPLYAACLIRGLFKGPFSAETGGSVERVSWPFLRWIYAYPPHAFSSSSLWLSEYLDISFFFPLKNYSLLKRVKLPTITAFITKSNIADFLFSKLNWENVLEC